MSNEIDADVTAINEVTENGVRAWRGCTQDPERLVWELASYFCMLTQERTSRGRGSACDEDIMEENIGRFDAEATNRPGKLPHVIGVDMLDDYAINSLGAQSLHRSAEGMWKHHSSCPADVERVGRSDRQR